MPKSLGAWGSASSRQAVALALAAGLVAQCGPPTRRGDVVFYASGADLQSINPLVTVHPLAKQVQKHVLFLTLVTYDSAMHPVPRLATPAWSADRRSLTFRLRRDVRWDDGVPTAAEDVRWTLAMARHPDVGYPRAADLADVAGVDAVDSFTVRVRFARPKPVFPDVFADLAILPAHRFRGVGAREVRTAEYNQRPVGNGPFTFIEHRPEQRWVFRRSAGFPEDLGRPAIDRLVIVVVDEPATKLAGLTSGELDFAGISPAHAEFVRADPRLRVIDYPFMQVYTVTWNLRRPPFDDPAVRKALDLAIDRQQIVEAYIHGFGTVAAGPVPPEHPWYQPVDPIAHDTVAAGRLLEDAGWRRGADGVRTKAGRRLDFELLTVGSGDNALEQMLQAEFAAVGASARIRQLELSTLAARLQSPARDFDAVVWGVVGDLSLGYIAATLGGRDPGPLAYPGYGSAEFDAVLDRARGAASEPDLIRAWREAQRIIARDRPVSWLYHARGLQGVNRRVRNVEIDLRGELANVARWAF